MRRIVWSRFSFGLVAGILTLAGGIGVLYFWTYHNNPVVLEIYTDCRGTTYPRGQVLDFRLYLDGRVEYDQYPSDQSSAHFHFRYWFPKTHMYVGSDEVTRLLRLAEQPDFLTAESEYPAAIPGVDSEFRTLILFSHAGDQKKILLIDYYGDDGVGAKDRYPKSLLLLLQKTNALKRK